MTQEIKLEEVSKHNSKKSVWVIIHNDIYDVTHFLDEHPGGPDSILDFAGKDGTQAFEDVAHSADARELMKKYKVGTLPANQRIVAPGTTGHNTCSSTPAFTREVIVMPVIISEKNNKFRCGKTDSQKCLKNSHNILVKDMPESSSRRSYKISRCSDPKLGPNKEHLKNVRAYERSPSKLPRNTSGPTTHLNREVIVMPASSDNNKNNYSKRDSKKEPVKSWRAFEGSSCDKDPRSRVSITDRKSDPQLEGRKYSSVPRERRPRGLPCARSGHSASGLTDTTLYDERGWRTSSGSSSNTKKLKYALLALAGAVVVGLVMKKYMSA